MSRPILNIADVEFQPWGHGDRFQARIGRIAPQIGAQKLGYSITIVPPGKCAFPFHSHRVNEEMFFIVAGVGELRLGEERHALKRGDVVACPPGGPETAHQIRNTSGDTDLEYLAVSTSLSPEIAEYPDSNKIGIYDWPSGKGHDESRVLRVITRERANFEDYWDGE